MISGNAEQIHYLRELARKLQEISHTEENDRNRQRWADHNDLKAIQRPLLWVCPDDDGAWLELVPDESLQCEDPDYRELEKRIRKYLYQHEHLKDDFVFESSVYFNMPGTYTGYLYGSGDQKTAWGVRIEKKIVGKNAYHLDNFLNTEEDYETLLHHEVDFITDETEHARLKEKYEEALDGILKVEFHLPYSVLVQSHLIELTHLRGLSNLMYDLYDEPELLGDVLHHMGETKARLLKKLEAEHRLFENRKNIYTGSGGLGYSNAPQKKDGDILLKDMWGFADAQEFSGVSPQMFDEFAIQNQKLGLNLFGFGCYGCCEPLDNKYDAIYRNITNVRRLSVSPWSDIPMAVENIGQRAIFSWKPDPAKICNGFDEDEVLQWLQGVADQTKDCFTEIILKDLRTCGGTSRHLEKFISLVRRTFG